MTQVHATPGQVAADKLSEKTCKDLPLHNFHIFSIDVHQFLWFYDLSKAPNKAIDIGFTDT